MLSFRRRLGRHLCPRGALRAAWLLCGGLLAPLFAAAPDPLAAGFDRPPPDARPLVWWHWMDGNVTKAGIAADLADMRRVGIAGVQMFDASLHAPPGPVRYGTENWHDHVQFAIRRAAELGLEFHFMNTPGWSASAGPWVTPERSMKKLVWTETPALGDRALVLTLRAPETKLGFYRDIAVLAIPESPDVARRLAEPARRLALAKATKMPGGTGVVRCALDATPAADGPAIPRAAVLDLTAQCDATGRLSVRLPAGEWTILRFGYTTTGAKNHPAVPEGTGLEIDKLDAAAVSFQFDQALGRLLRDAGPLVGKTVKAVLFDSFEAGGQNWTEAFPRLFATRCGYELIPLLPILAGRTLDTPAFTESVLHDFRGTIDDLIARAYFGTMQRRAHEHGLLTYAEAQGGPLNPVVIAPYVDVPMNEFWVGGFAERMARMKLVASAADALGQRLVAAEAFTAKPEDGRWQAVPSNLKAPGDYAWTAGMNRFIFHNYTHQPTEHAPGFSLGRYGTHFGRLNSWWEYAGAWIDYLARGQFLLQQGVRVAEVGYLLNADHDYGFPTKLLQPQPGYDFTIVYPHHVADLRWTDGAMRLPTGVALRLLVLPENWAAEIATLRQLRDLVRAGAAIVGPAPVAPAGGRDYAARAEWRQLVAELWSAPPGGAPRIRPLASVAEALRGHAIPPDLSWTGQPAAGEIRFVHRRTADADLYFVFNYSAQPFAADFTCRVRDRRPEIWDAVAGTRADAPVFRATAEGIAVPLALEAYGSRFIVLRRPLPSRWLTRTEPALAATAEGRLVAWPAATSAERRIALHDSTGAVRTLALPGVVPPPLALDGAWDVAFLDGRGGPDRATFAALHSWSDDPAPGLRHYAGRATYRRTFTLPPDALRSDLSAWLDLGGVADLANVRLNDRPLGVLWQPPFRVEVTAQLRPGENRLEVTVANRWINRLIGDEAIPTELRYRTGGSIFTTGGLLNAPAWLYDATKLADKKRVSFTTWKHYEATSPLVPAGLLGPVRVVFAPVVLAP